MMKKMLMLDVAYNSQALIESWAVIHEFFDDKKAGQTDKTVCLVVNAVLVTKDPTFNHL